VQERVETSRQLAFEVLVPAVEDVVDRVVRAHTP
jgi:diacylglycerol kinase